MARVPTYFGGTVQRQGTTDARLRPADTRAEVTAPRSIARALQNEAEVRVIEAEEQRQVDRMQLTTGWLGVQDNLNRRVTGLRENAATEAAGHLDQVGSAFDEETQSFMEGIADPVLRREFEQRAAAVRTTTLDRERSYASEARQRALADNTEVAITTATNQLQTDPTPERLESARTELYQTLDTMSDMPEALRTEMRRKVDQSTALGYLSGLGADNPAAALQTIESGLFDNVLSAEQRRRLQDQFGTDVRRRQNQALAQARTQIDLLQRRLRDHDPTLTDEDLQRAQELATAAGLATEQYDVAKARIELQVDQQYRTATGLEISGAIRELDTRIAQGGQNASPEDVVRRDRLQSLQASRQRQDQNDPLSSFTQRGGALAPVNFSDPTSVRSRVEAARTAERQTGYFSFFTPQEAALAQQRVNSGAAGRMQVANEIAAIGAFDPLAAVRTAQQVAPNDGAFRQAVRLPIGTRALVIRGTEARATIPPRVTMPDGSQSSFNTATQSWFAANVVPLLSRSDPAFVNDTLEAARAIYAELLRTSGATGTADAGEFNPGHFQAAVHFALGGAGSRGGGLGRYDGGPRGAGGNAPMIILPQSMTQAEFNRRLANMPRRDANGNRDWRGSANGAPVWGDGSTMSTDDIRRRFAPVAVRDGVYQFEWGGQIVMTREGRPFQLDVRRIPMPTGAQGSGQVEPRRTARPPQRAQPAIPQLPDPGVQGPVWRGN